jgi:hypothetical protein
MSWLALGTEANMDSLIGLECPSCKEVCPVRLVLLTVDGRIVYLSACPRCADGVTVRCYKVIMPKVYAFALNNGLPVVEYGRKNGK